MKLFGKGKTKGRSAPNTRAGRILDDAQREIDARRQAEADQVAAQRRKHGQS